MTMKEFLTKVAETSTDAEVIAKANEELAKRFNRTVTEIDLLLELPD